MVAGLAVAAMAGYWYWTTQRADEPEPAAIPAAATELVTVPPPKFPLAPEDQAQAAREPLPALGDSDAAFGVALESVLPSATGRDFFLWDNVIRRWVVTIDALPKASISQRLRPVTRFNDSFVADPVADQAEQYTLSTSNYTRYEPLLALAEQIDLEAAVNIYRQFYPLLQQSYTEAIDPHGYFNDRLVAVIDHLLATREVTEPVLLVRPSVMYQFADPALESLSVGEKTLIRMGPTNAERVKTLLRRLRAVLTTTS